MARTMITTATATTNNTAALSALTAGIRKYNVLSAEEEVEKFTEFSALEEGERKAELRTEIANANLRFVLSVAKKFSNDGDKVCELVSLGTLGLYRAIDTFDVTMGFKFISHAIHWIRAEISDYYRNDANLVRRSNNAKIGSKDTAARERFIQMNQREPSEEELIDALEREYGIKVLDKVDIIKVRTSSMDERVSADGESDTLGEVGEIALATASRNAFERKIEEEDARQNVSRLLAVLSVKEQQVVSRKFGIGYEREYELEEIADALGYTAERCRQLLKAALAKMKGKAQRMKIG